MWRIRAPATRKVDPVLFELRAGVKRDANQIFLKSREGGEVAFVISLNITLLIPIGLLRPITINLFYQTEQFPSEFRRIARVKSHLLGKEPNVTNMLGLIRRLLSDCFQNVLLYSLLLSSRCYLISIYPTLKFNAYRLS